MDNNNFVESKRHLAKNRHRRTQSHSINLNEHNVEIVEDQFSQKKPQEISIRKFTNFSTEIDTKKALEKNAQETKEREIIIETLEIPSSPDSLLFFSDEFAFGKQRRRYEETRDGSLKAKHFPKMSSIRELDLNEECSETEKMDWKSVLKQIEQRPSEEKENNEPDQRNSSNQKSKKKFNFLSMNFNLTAQVKEKAKKIDFGKIMTFERKKTSSLVQDDFKKIGTKLKGHFRQISDGKLAIKYLETKKSEKDTQYEKKLFTLEKEVRNLKEKVGELDERNSVLSQNTLVLKVQNLELENVCILNQRNSELQKKISSMEQTIKKNLIALNAIKAFLMNGDFHCRIQNMNIGVNQNFENIYLDLKHINSLPQNPLSQIISSMNNKNFQSHEDKVTRNSKNVRRL